MSLLRFVAAGACAVLLAAGCSDPPKRDYSRQMKREVAGALHGFDSLNRPDAARFRQVAADLRSTARSIDQIRPPADVRKLHERTAADLRAVADVFIRLAPMAEQLSDEPASAQMIRRRYAGPIDELTRLGHDLDAIDAEYQQRGYDIGLTRPA